MPLAGMQGCETDGFPLSPRHWGQARRKREVISIKFSEIEENDMRGIADRRVMAGETEAAGLTIHSEDGNVVGPLVAAIKEPARGVETEAARIIPSCPFLSNEGEFTIGANGKDPDTVVKSITRIDKSPIVRHQNLRAKVATGKPWRQRRDCLA